MQPYVARPWGIIGTKHLIDHKRTMLIADPGLGKTSMVLAAAQILKMLGSNFFPALVFAPKRVADVVWTGEQKKWDAFQDLRVTQIVGSPEERLAILRQPKSDLYVANYELIPWFMKQWTQENWPFKLVIPDECQRLQGFRLEKGSSWATHLSNIAKYTGRWWNLTGTPSSNGLQALWGQMWFIDYGLSLGRTYTDFMQTFFREHPYTRKITLLPGAADEIRKLVAPHMLVLRAEDWLDLQVPQYIPVPFNLPTSARIAYMEMERKLFTEVGDRGIEAKTAAAKWSKLLQMCSGSVYDEAHGPHDVHEEKMEALRDVVDQNGGEPLLVTYWWKFDPDNIRKAFPHARVYEGQRTEDEWNAGKIKMLLLHEQSAHGLSLHEVCRDVCFFSYTSNAELRKQMIARIGPVRQFQAGFKRIVRVWDIQADDTIEQDVIESNDEKLSVEDAFRRGQARRKL